VALIWALRAGLAATILVLLVLAGRAQQGPPTELSAAPAVPTDPAVPTSAATPRPTATPAAVISRMARSTPTPTPRREVAEPGPPRVSVHDAGFDPPELRVRAGQGVTWKNDGAASHDVSALGGEAWGSGPLLTTGTFSRVFSTPGQYDYFCSLHPTMRGRIVVGP
jgi:plastocyanin